MTAACGCAALGADGAGVIGGGTTGLDEEISDGGSITSISTCWWLPLPWARAGGDWSLPQCHAGVEESAVPVPVPPSRGSKSVAAAAACLLVRLEDAL
jgi:hypothetical protein